jgi:hypothetical protein
LSTPVTAGKADSGDHSSAAFHTGLPLEFTGTLGEMCETGREVGFEDPDFKSLHCRSHSDFQSLCPYTGKGVQKDTIAKSSLKRVV